MCPEGPRARLQGTDKARPYAPSTKPPSTKPRSPHPTSSAFLEQVTLGHTGWSTNTRGGQWGTGRSPPGRHSCLPLHGRFSRLPTWLSFLTRLLR